MIKIKNRFNGNIIIAGEYEGIKEFKIKISGLPECGLFSSHKTTTQMS